MKLRPVNKRILVEKVTEKVLESGLILDDVNQEVILKGKISDYDPTITLKLSVNQEIFFNQTLADRVKTDDLTFFLVKEEDIIAVLGE